MEETIFEKITSECLHDPVKIHLKYNEELTIHFIRKNNKVYNKVILCKSDTEEEKELYLFDDYYDEMLVGHMFIIFQLETRCIPDIHIVLIYDRELETFILGYYS
jgi:hypothetical protein